MEPNERSGRTVTLADILFGSNPDQDGKDSFKEFLTSHSKCDCKPTTVDVLVRGTGPGGEIGAITVTNVIHIKETSAGNLLLLDKEGTTLFAVAQTYFVCLKTTHIDGTEVGNSIATSEDTK